jgi:Pyridine nucleotide-disulphide oxidoreductase
MGNETEIAIIGAGPYGLALASHLGAHRVDHRIFGSPMHTWMNQMPAGMHLKSEGFASTLYDAGSAFTLRDFCASRGIPYADMGLPVKLDTFVSYGLEFQRRVVPELEEKQVIFVEKSGGRFHLRLDNGELVTATRVVVAAGISHFQYLPAELSSLPREVVTHTSAHRHLDRFCGKEVTVVGAGASALDTAALLVEAGAAVQIVARKRTIHFHNPPGKIPRPLGERLRAPTTGLGPGWRSFLCTEAPLLFHQMPVNFRKKVVQKHLGPAAAWFIKDKVAHIDRHLGFNIDHGHVKGGRVHLQISNGSTTKFLTSDHVIAGTGYRVDIDRLAFLSPRILKEIRCLDRVPELNSGFESSIESLYFVGAAAALSFGPLLRFAYGAKFASRRLSQALADSAGRHSTVAVPAIHHAVNGNYDAPSPDKTRTEWTRG